MANQELSEQEIVRRRSLEALRERGIDPYPAAEYPVSGYSREIKENFDDNLTPPREVAVAGRIMSRRIMGKASFMELQDSEGRIQIYVSRDDICPGEDKEFYNVVFKKLLDIGDFIGVKGYVFRTQMGEISIHSREITVLGKSLRPALPSALCRSCGKSRCARHIPEKNTHVQFNARVFQFVQLHRGRDSDSAIDTRRCRRASLHHASQRA